MHFNKMRKLSGTSLEEDHFFISSHLTTAMVTKLWTATNHVFVCRHWEQFLLINQSLRALLRDADCVVTSLQSAASF